MKKNTTVYILAGALTILACLSILLLVSNSRKKVIIEDITAGMHQENHTVVEDRREAIRYAIVNAQPGDVILLAGKGHEDYQEIKGVHYPFDEKVVVGEILDELER